MANPTFEIPKDVIEPIIQAQVMTAVAQALQPHGRVLEQVVAHVIQTQVDSDGKPSSYNGRPWIDWVVADCLHKAARQAIEEFLSTEKDKIRDAIGRQLSQRNSPLARQLIEAMVAGMTAAETLKYRLTVTADRK